MTRMVGRVCKLALLGLAATCIASFPARAQLEQPTGPVNRPRPEYQPVGGRVGAFMIYPGFNVDAEYNDNIFASETAASDDLILRLRPQVRVEPLWRRHRLALNAYLSQSLYARHGDENSLQGGIRVNGTLDVTRDSAVRATLTYDALAQERFDFGSIDEARSPVRYHRLAGTFNYTHDLDPVRLHAETRVGLLDFQDVRARSGAVIDQDFRDSLYLSLAGSVDYRISPGISALGRITVDKLDFENHPGGNALDRDSTGIKVEGGVYLELSRLIIGELRAGYLHRNSADSRLPDVTGLSFAASLTWTITPLTTLRLYADRAIEEGGTEITAGNLRSQVQLSVEHELLRSLVLEGQARYAVIDPLGPLSIAREYELTANATYYLSRRFRLFGSLRRIDRDSRSFADFEQNRILIGVRAVF